MPFPSLASAVKLIFIDDCMKHKIEQRKCDLAIFTEKFSSSGLVTLRGKKSLSSSFFFFNLFFGESKRRGTNEAIYVLDFSLFPAKKFHLSRKEGWKVPLTFEFQVEPYWKEIAERVSWIADFKNLVE